MIETWNSQKLKVTMNRHHIYLILKLMRRTRSIQFQDPYAKIGSPRLDHLDSFQLHYHPLEEILQLIVVVVVMCSVLSAFWSVVLLLVVHSLCYQAMELQVKHLYIGSAHEPG